MWHEHEKWYEELRQFLGSDADNISEEDMMFVSNLAAQTVHGNISLNDALREITKWQQAGMGFLGGLNEEQFHLELQVNHPDLIDVTIAVKQNLRMAEEPGIADAFMQVWAHPNFTEFVEHGSMVAMQHKAWFALERLTQAEHQIVGWAIHMAVQERANGN